MFSGIVEEVGQVASFDGSRLVIRASAVLSDLKVSDSILVSGACLTVVERGPDSFTVETVPETLDHTNFRSLVTGSRVNLERALAYGARIGGHLVQGHVDGTGKVRRIEPDGNSLRVWFQADEPIMKYVVPKGFIAVDGISLTLVDRDTSGFSVAIIPYTQEHTTIGARKAGDLVNLEADITAKYVEQIAAPYLAGSR